MNLEKRGIRKNILQSQCQLETEIHWTLQEKITSGKQKIVNLFKNKDNSLLNKIWKKY